VAKEAPEENESMQETRAIYYMDETWVSAERWTHCQEIADTKIK
jgi:hypothetical protein